MTPLETTLAGALLAVFVALITHVLTTRRFVSKDDCRLLHGQLCTEQVKSANKLDIIFRMLRGVVAHMGLPADVQERLLNTREGE